MQSADTPPFGERLALAPAWRLYLLRSLAVLASYVLFAYPLNSIEPSRYVIGPIGLHMGFAMAALLCWRVSLWPSVFLGFAGMVLLDTERQGWDGIRVALLLSVGHLLTLLFAAGLVRRWTPRASLTLLDLPSAMRFLGLTAFVATTAQASWGTLVLVLFLQLPGSEGPSMWLDWWLSDAGGMLVTLPIALCLIARPREVWRPRLFSVGLLSLLATVLLVLVIALMSRWDVERQLGGFRRDASATADAIENELQNTLGTLHTAHALMARGRADDEALASLRRGRRIDALGEIRLPARGGAMVAGAAGAGGEEGEDDPAAALAAVALLAPGRPPAALSSTLFHKPGDPSGAPPRLAVFQPLPQSPTGGGLAVMTLRPAALIAGVLRAGADKVQACLLDGRDAGSARVLAGAAGCEQELKFRPSFWRELRFVDHRWRLRVYSDAGAPLSASRSAKLIEFMGIVCLALITALTLTQSAKAQHALSLMQQRTTELQQTSQALRGVEQRFRSVFDAAPVGVCISTLDGRPLNANPEFCRMLGVSPDEFPRRSEAFRAEDAALARRLADADETTLHVQRSFPRAGGGEVQGDLLFKLLRDAEGRPEALLCIAQDITERLLLAEHERARQAAELANRAKSEFLSRMSHELRTPLNGLLGFTQLLQMEREPLTAIQRAWMARIGQAGWHLLAMINDVLDLSRVETGNLKVTLEPQDAHELARECLTLLTPLASRRNISVRLTLDPAARYITADATRVREILNNLLSNAVKYNRPDGSVHLHLHGSGADLVDMSVSDTGKGLKPEQLAQLFKPFNRLGQERSGIEGTGIGLVITRRLAELMNGSIIVESRPDEGSTFTLRLPASSTPPDTAPAAPGATPGEAAGLGPKRLVYIEDNPVNIEVMKAVIALRHGVSLAVYEDGETGLPALLREPPDLLLLDMNLPDMDGLTLLKRLRAAPQCTTLPVVIVSADAMDEHIAAGMRSGAVHYLTKPFAVPELMKLLDRLLAS